MDEKECQIMIDDCKKNKVKLTIGYRMQHEPRYRGTAYCDTRKEVTLALSWN